ncbi:MAG: glycosyltransferase [Patescibacteria group bacterium UBA2163]
MKLLIITQVVDRNHPILGFFHRWLVEFAKNAEHIHVIALQTGDYDLPKNVTVHSLGKERGTNKFQQLTTFYLLLSKLHREYDGVFVHMNPEYIVLAGWIWRLTGKTLGLWYMHKSVDLKLRFAEVFAQHIFTATPGSFRLQSKKVQIMGHGIDVDVFTPGATVERAEHLLSVGRLMKTKRHDLVIEAAAASRKPVRIIGEGEERERLAALAQKLGAKVEMPAGLSHKDLPDEYRRAAMFVHTSETGSLDKVVLEALACGCPVVTTNPTYTDMPVTIADPTTESLSRAVCAPTYTNTEDLYTYVKKNHSLQHLIPNILEVYAAHNF